MWTQQLSDNELLQALERQLRHASDKGLSEQQVVIYKHLNHLNEDLHGTHKADLPHLYFQIRLSLDALANNTTLGELQDQAKKGELFPSQVELLRHRRQRLEKLGQEYFTWPQSDTKSDSVTGDPIPALNQGKVTATHLPPALTDAIDHLTWQQANGVFTGGNATEQYSFAASMDATSCAFDTYWALGLLLPQLQPRMFNIIIFTPISGWTFLGVAIPAGLALGLWHYWIEQQEDDKYAALLFFHYLRFNKIWNKINKREKQHAEPSRTYTPQVLAPPPTTSSHELAVKPKPAFLKQDEEDGDRLLPLGSVLPGRIQNYWKKSVFGALTLGVFSYASTYGMLWALGSIDAFGFKAILMHIHPLLYANWYIVAGLVSITYAILVGVWYYKQLRRNQSTQKKIQDGLDHIDRLNRRLRKLQHESFDPEAMHIAELSPAEKTPDASTITKLFNFLEKSICLTLAFYFAYWAMNAVFPPSVIFAPFIAFPMLLLVVVLGPLFTYQFFSEDEENLPRKCDDMLIKNKAERAYYHQLLAQLHHKVTESAEIIPVQNLDQEKTAVSAILDQEEYLQTTLAEQFSPVKANKKIGKFRAIAELGARVQLNTPKTGFFRDKAASSAAVSGFITFVMILDFYWCATEVKGLLIASLITSSPVSLIIFASVMAVALLLSLCIAYHAYQSGHLRSEAQLKLVKLHSEHASLLEQVHHTHKLLDWMSTKQEKLTADQQDSAVAQFKSGNLIAFPESPRAAN